MLFICFGCRYQAHKIDPAANQLNTIASKLIAKYGSNPDSLLFAVQLLDSAVLIDKSFVTAYQNKVAAECSLGKYEGAINDIDRILTIKKDFVGEKVNKGFILEKINRKDEATKLYQEALVDYNARIKKDSTNLNNLVNAAFLTMLVFGKDEGINAYQKILKKYPNEKKIIGINFMFYSFDRNAFISQQVGAHLFNK